MKRTGIYTILALAMTSMVSTSCSDDIDLVIPHATNITFDEVAPPQRFSHVITQGGFDVQGIHFNAVSSGNQLTGGFCAKQPQHALSHLDRNRGCRRLNALQHFLDPTQHHRHISGVSRQRR
ncbi:hypothetical protein [Duncaniella freteri]|uniref:hypothetical protein n=1 Tax=Duncaniella freteri TaxID=2530391 RepID=UPI003F6800D2